MAGVALFRISQSNPDAQFEPKEKAWHLSLALATILDQGSDLSRVHSLLLINGHWFTFTLAS
jgi:hypothetical protein